MTDRLINQAYGHEVFLGFIGKIVTIILMSCSKESHNFKAKFQGAVSHIGNTCIHMELTDEQSNLKR